MTRNDDLHRHDLLQTAHHNLEKFLARLSERSLARSFFRFDKGYFTFEATQSQHEAQKYKRNLW